MGRYSHRFTIILIHPKNHGSNTCYSNIRKLGSGSMSFDRGGHKPSPNGTFWIIIQQQDAHLRFSWTFCGSIFDILPITSPFLFVCFVPPTNQAIFLNRWMSGVQVLNLANSVTKWTRTLVLTGQERGFKSRRRSWGCWYFSDLVGEFWRLCFVFLHWSQILGVCIFNCS